MTFIRLYLERRRYGFSRKNAARLAWQQVRGTY